MSTNYISQITATDGITYDVQEGVTTRIFRATCSTAPATATKVATLDDETGYSLAAGVRVAVTFTYGNTATSPTLNVNSGGAKNIYYRTAASTTQQVDELCVWGASETVIFTYNGSSWIMMGSSLALYNAYNKAASSGSGTITEVKTNAGAHATIDVLSGKAEFNIPTTAAHVGAATSDHTHGNITSGGDITATAPTIASGDQIIINDNSASKITNGPTFDGSTTTTALTPKGTWESFSKFSGSYNDLTNTPTIPTKTSDLTNDSGFITSSSLNNYLEKSYTGSNQTGSIGWNTDNNNNDIYLLTQVDNTTEATSSYIGINSNSVDLSTTYNEDEDSFTGEITVASKRVDIGFSNDSGVGDTLYYLTIDEYNGYNFRSINNYDYYNIYIPKNKSGTIALTSDIPTETTVSDWGFTKNTGTLTGVTFAGTSMSVSSGVASITQANARTALGLATVATSGSYNDLTNKPTIPTKVSDLTNDSGFITSYVDTKNTAGSTNSTSKIYLIGATEQSANPQTYSNSKLYFSGGLYSDFSHSSTGLRSTISQNYISGIELYAGSTQSPVRSTKINVTDSKTSISGKSDTNDAIEYISVGSNGNVVVTGLVTPTNDTDAATKKYVDDSIGAIPAASITLNGTSTTSASFYAPTAAGSSGQYLQSNGSGAPTWADLPTDNPDTLVIHLVRTGSEPEYDIDSSFSIIYALYHDNKFVYLVDTDTERIYYLKTITQSVARFSRIDYSEYEDNSTITKTISEDYFFINSDDTIEFHPYSSIVPTKTSDLTNDSGFITSYTDEKLKWTTSTSSTTYYPLQSTATATTSTANTLNGISFYQYYNTAGGYRRLNLGNSTAYTSSGGAYGKIRLYGTGATYYGDINPGTIGANSLTANRTWTLPDKTGTIALTDDIPSVPSWALQSTKPTYTASEVGALSDTTTIPTNWLNGSATGSVRTIGSATEDSSYTMGDYAVAEGSSTYASGEHSHAEGYGTHATNATAHAEGGYTTASGGYSHAEGFNTTSSYSYSHAEGSNTTASGSSSHAEGFHAIASGSYSHAGGYYTTAQRKSQTAIGEYNILDTTGTTTTRGDYAFIIGNGTSEDARSNALAVKWDGTVETAKGNLSGVKITRW